MQEPAHIKLAAWLEKNRRTDQWLAEQIGVTQPQAWRLRNGKGRTSPERAVAIERLTRGAVKAVGLLTDPLAANENARPSSQDAAA